MLDLQKEHTTSDDMTNPTVSPSVYKVLTTHSHEEIPNISTRRPQLTTETLMEITTEYEPDLRMTTSLAKTKHSLDPNVSDNGQNETNKFSQNEDEHHNDSPNDKIPLLESFATISDVSPESTTKSFLPTVNENASSEEQPSKEDDISTSTEATQTSSEIKDVSTDNTKYPTERKTGTSITEGRNVSEPVVEAVVTNAPVTAAVGDKTKVDADATEAETEVIATSSIAPKRDMDPGKTIISTVTDQPQITIQREYFIETGVTYQEPSTASTTVKEQSKGTVTQRQGMTGGHMTDGELKDSPAQTAFGSTRHINLATILPPVNSSNIKPPSTGQGTQMPNISTIQSEIPVRLQTPVMDLDLHLNNSDLATLSYVAALPGGEAIVVNYISKNRTDQIVLVDNQGRTVRSLYTCKQCGGITGLLVVKSSLYILHTNGKIIEIVIPNGPLLRTYQVDVGYMMHAGSLYPKPLNISDVLVLGDYARGQVFTYTLSSGVKSVKVTGLQTPTSVAYLPSDNGTNYVVCDSIASTLKIYDENWSFVKQFGSYGRGDGEMIHPSSAVTTPDGRILVADYYNSRVSEFDASGRFIRNLLTKRKNRIWKPFALSFSYPHLWVGYYTRGNNIKRFKLYQS